MTTQANITIDQGCDFLVDIDLKDSTGAAQSLSGYTVVGTIKKTYQSTTAHTFTATITSIEGGTIRLALSNTTTAGLSAGRYVYDVEITKTATSTITRVLSGQAQVTPSVTV